MLRNMSPSARQYLIITLNYWTFTLTDGALRMLVVLYFHQLGYSPLQIALLFVLYEFFGVVTNLLGGWLGARWGLNHTMNLGLALQIAALAMLALPSSFLNVLWVMAAQTLSGIAKDLNKMSAKSAIKLLVPENKSNTLYRWVARLTGSKNTLKGVGFFVGGALLMSLGFQAAVLLLASGLVLTWTTSLFLLERGLGKASNKPKFTQLVSKSKAINRLSLARLFLFGARDVWFVVALPVFLSLQLGWSHSQIGAFMASWIIAYGLVQTQAPIITQGRAIPDGTQATNWVAALTLIMAIIAMSVLMEIPLLGQTLIAGLMVFGFVFAINSSVHSFLIVHYASRDAISIDVGFYYMANAAGRLIGTVLSGWVFQVYGLAACLLVATGFLILATLISNTLPKTDQEI